VDQFGLWFPDYVADLDSIVRQLSPDQPLRLVGHSMGGRSRACTPGCARIG